MVLSAVVPTKRIITIVPRTYRVLKIILYLTFREIQMEPCRKQQYWLDGCPFVDPSWYFFSISMSCTSQTMLHRSEEVGMKSWKSE
ncbi:uncharacterized protein LOC143199189 isoform X2 [Rhynchophorus ferrugineus]|uniref:uncharacterized protein LOC143199189 isoform X2 n=1 Tax=Rhynchophorus ferrugineus TaxID=354439 RepID=UPI003FCCED9F